MLKKLMDETGLFDVPLTRVHDVPGNQAPWTDNPGTNDSTADKKYVPIAESKPSQIKVRTRYSQKMAKQLQAIGVDVDLESGVENKASENQELLVGNGVSPSPLTEKDVTSPSLDKDRLLESIADETLEALDESPDNTNSNEDTESVLSLSSWDPMKASYENKTFNSYEKQNYNDDFRQKHSLITGPDGKINISPAKLSEENLKLFIGNIPLSLTEEGLANMFSTVGKCVDVKRCRPKEGRTETIGFVSYKSVKEAEAAIRKYNDFAFGNDTKLRVKLAHNTDSSHAEIHWGDETNGVNRNEESWDTPSNNASPIKKEYESVGILEYRDARCNTKPVTENTLLHGNVFQGSKKKELWSDLKNTATKGDPISSKKQPMTLYGNPITSAEPVKEYTLLNGSISQESKKELWSDLKNTATKGDPIPSKKEPTTLCGKVITSPAEPVKEYTASNGNVYQERASKEVTQTKELLSDGNNNGSKDDQTLCKKEAVIISENKESTIPSKPVIEKREEKRSYVPLTTIKEMEARRQNLKSETEIPKKPVIASINAPRLYVQGIKVGTTVLELREFFLQIGPVSYEAIHPPTKPNQYTTYGFLSYPNLDLCHAAIDRFNGVVFKGKTLNVEFTDDTKRLYGMMAEDEDEALFYDKLYDEDVINPSLVDESTSTEVVENKVTEKKSMENCIALDANATQDTDVDANLMENRIPSTLDTLESTYNNTGSKLLGYVTTDDSAKMTQQTRKLSPSKMENVEKNSETKPVSAIPGMTSVSTDILQKLKLLSGSINQLCKENSATLDERYLQSEVHEIAAGVWDDTLGSVSSWMPVIIKGCIQDQGELVVTSKQITERVSIIIDSIRTYQNITKHDQNDQIEKTVKELLKGLSASNESLIEGLDVFKSTIIDNITSLKNKVEQLPVSAGLPVSTGSHLDELNDHEEAFLRAYMMGYYHGSQDLQGVTETSIKEALLKFIQAMKEQGGLTGNMKRDAERYHNMYRHK